jgi:hypothetical protein
VTPGKHVLIARSPTHAETAQRVLNTPGLVTRLADNCVAASPTLSNLSVSAQQVAFAELRDLIQAELERIAKAGPHCPEPK